MLSHGIAENDLTSEGRVGQRDGLDRTTVAVHGIPEEMKEHQ